MMNSLFVGLFCLVALTAAFEFAPEYGSNDCIIPRISEYLQDFKIPVNDLSTLINSNLSSLPISDLQNKNTKFYHINTNLTYNGTGRSINRITLQQYAVDNDSFSMSITWSADVAKTIGHSTYNVTAKVSSVPVSFKKGINMQQGINPFYVNGTTYTFTSSSISIVSINPDPAGNKDKIMALMPNLFTAIDQQFKSIGSWLNDNAKKQSLGTIFTDPTYVYDFYGWQQTISTKVMSIVRPSINDTLDFLVGYIGEIVGQSDSLCPERIPFEGVDSYNQFISLEFIQNMAKNVAAQYVSYQNIPINSTWIRSRNFQFKLIDLEFVLQDALTKYNTLFMNQIDFACSLKQVLSGYIDDDGKNLHQIIHWGCEGYIINGTEKIKILDFEPQIDHLLNFRISGDTLAVYSNVLTLLDITFNEVDGMKVNNIELAKIIMKQFYNDMRRYVPGTYFKVKKGSSYLKWVSDHSAGLVGLWIG